MQRNICDLEVWILPHPNRRHSQTSKLMVYATYLSAMALERSLLAEERALVQMSFCALWESHWNRQKETSPG
jgi:hypothetical protein